MIFYLSNDQSFTCWLPESSAICYTACETDRGTRAGSNCLSGRQGLELLRWEKLGRQSIFFFLAVGKSQKKKKPNLVLLCLKKITRQYTIFILVSEQIGHLKTSAILYPCLSNRKDINKARFMAFASTATWETHTWEYLHTRSFYSIHCTMQMSGRRTWFLLEKDHAFASEYTFNLLQMDRNRVLIPSLTWAYCHAGSSFQWCTEIALLPLVSSLFGEGPGRLSLLSDSSWLAPSGLSSRLPDLPHFWHCSSWFRSTWTTNK